MYHWIIITIIYRRPSECKNIEKVSAICVWMNQFPGASNMRHMHAMRNLYTPFLFTWHDIDTHMCGICSSVLCHLSCARIHRNERQPTRNETEKKKIQSEVPSMDVVRSSSAIGVDCVNSIFFSLVLLIYRYAKLSPFNRPMHLQIQLKSDCAYEDNDAAKNKNKKKNNMKKQGKTSHWIATSHFQFKLNFCTSRKNWWATWIRVVRAVDVTWKQTQKKNRLHTSAKIECNMQIKKEKN